MEKVWGMGASEPTTLQDALEQLRISKERYRIAAETSSELIFEYNYLNHSLLHATDRVEAIYGMPRVIEDAPDALVKSGVVRPESAQDLMELFQKIHDGTPRAQCVLRTRTANGAQRWNSLTLTAIFNDKQKVTRAIGVLRDITRQKEAEQHYEQEAAHETGCAPTDISLFTGDPMLYHAFAHSTDDYLWVGNIPRNLCYFPQNMVDEFDLPGQLVEDSTQAWARLLHESDRVAFLQAFQDLFSGKTDDFSQEYRAKNRAGNWVWLRCRGHLEHNADGAPTLFAGVTTNLGKKGKVDHVSGLPNKFEFERHVRSHLADKKPGTLLLLGLDNFKHINKLYGLEFGDKVIRVTANRLQELLPRRVRAYRMNGDMFGVLFPSDDPGAAESAYLTIQAAFRAQQIVDGHRYTSTFSGGCVSFSDAHVSFDVLFKQAEYALENAKTEGKNRLDFYSGETLNGRERSLTLIELLRESIEKNFADFEVYYQPQVDVPTQEVVSAEALLRWRCTKYGSVSPVEFIPLLEQTGMIQAVGNWVLMDATETCRQWRMRFPAFTVSVNLSYLQLMEKDFVPHLLQILCSKGLAPEALHLELTESHVADGNALARAFHELRLLGFCIEMDDFGTGYSSLEILKNKPTDVVKVDRAFVKDIGRSDFDATFIRFVVSLCHSVNIRVCLEGIESREEFVLVQHMGLDLIQGYLFGRPVSKADFEALHFEK